MQNCAWGGSPRRGEAGVDRVFETGRGLATGCADSTLGATKAYGQGWKVFPNGIYYGTVDGYPVTAPVATEEHAVHQAYELLSGGVYEASLRAELDYYLRKLACNRDCPDKDKIGKEVALLRCRLMKAQAAGFVRKLGVNEKTAGLSERFGTEWGLGVEGCAL